MILLENMQSIFFLMTVYPEMWLEIRLDMGKNIVRYC